MLRIVILCCFIPAFLSAQSLENIRKKSHQTLAFKVSTTSAEQFIKQDNIPVDLFKDQQPIYIFNADKIDTDSLPIGHFVLLTVVDSMIKAELICNSNLLVYTINNQHRLQIEVKNKQGVFITNASVFVNGKKASYNSSAQNYTVPQRKPDEAFVRVDAPNDTIFINLEAQDFVRQTITQQRWKKFKLTKFYRTVSWLPLQVASIFKKKHYRYKSTLAGTHGLMVFNQPKYKINDTVRLKAYLFTKNNHQYKKSVTAYLQYYNRQNITQKLAVLQPSNPGSFVYEFVLRDTLVNDVNYTVIFKDDKDKILLRNNFKTEDYVLDEVATYTIRSDKEDYFEHDSIRFYATAKDANGLNLLDGTAKLILTTKNILHFYKDSLQIKDTLFVEEKKLATQGDTKFSIATEALPDAALGISAQLVFKNSNNELQYKTVAINYKPHFSELMAKQVGDSVFADFLVAGKSMPAVGEITDDGDSHTEKIKFPFKTKIDPFAQTYNFYRLEKDSIVDSDNVTIETNYRVSLSRISNGDTLGFSLANPYKIPVNYSVFKGNTLVASGKSNDANIEWKKVMSNKHLMYNIKWQYIWAGKEQEQHDNIALLYKLLDIKINTSATVFPGQKDSVEVVVNDYKNHPAEGVNLTAFSYNSQFKKDIRVLDPPYMQQYKNKAQLLYDKYEKDDAYITKNYSLGKHTSYIKMFGLDTMLYYQILFPKDSILDVVNRVDNYVPQLSVHVVKNGAPQQIYILYINNVFAYYYNTTDAQPYVFESLQGYTKIGIRLVDKYIEIDSVYTQPGYKHDLVFDLDKLPIIARVSSMDNYLNNREKSVIEQSMFQLQNDNRTNNSYVWQGNKVATLNGNFPHVVGPFRSNDSLHFFAPKQFDNHFVFEPFYQYKLSEKILRLEAMKLFPNDTRKYYLSPRKNLSLQLGDTIVPHPVIQYPKPEPPLPYLTITKQSNFWYKQANAFNKGNLQFELKKDTTFRYFVLQSLTDSVPDLIAYYDRKNYYNIPQGNYQLLLVMKDLSTVDAGKIEVLANTTLCLKIGQLFFQKSNVFIQEKAEENVYKPVAKAQLPKEEPVVVDHTPLVYPAGNGTIAGKVFDAKGKLPLVGASVVIKGTYAGVSTDKDGKFLIKNIKQGKYILLVSFIGYEQKQIAVTVGANSGAVMNTYLTFSNMNLDEVVVVGYGTSKKRDVTGAMSSISSMTINSAPIFSVNQALQGRVAGVNITDGSPGNDVKIIIRGANSISNSNQPIYVIDGIIYESMPPNIAPEMIENIEVLKDAAAMAVYGSRAANGVIVITTKTKNQRTVFRDNAFWQPELFTDKNGKAKFAVTYPDNITSWQTYVLAMDKHLRIGKAATFIQAYKPVLAQLSVPQFLTEGDTVELVGKSLNYTKDAYQITTTFSVNGKPFKQANQTLLPSESIVTNAAVFVDKMDTLKAAFDLQTTTGFKDGEERKIPVVKQGTEEATGNFWLLQNDTTITFKATEKPISISFSADNKTLDVLLKELDHLKDYPYYCMEQTASKLNGLLMEKKIRETLKQPFTSEKSIAQLLEKIQKAQLFDGSWPWWQNGKSNFYITNYITNILLQYRNNPLVEINIRNGLLYLQNQLAYLNKNELLTALNTLSAAKHVIDYLPYTTMLNFDSLSTHQQWQWAFVQQQTKGNYMPQLQQLIAKQQGSMLGSVYWGVDNYLWYNNNIATTVLAYKVLENEPSYQYILPRILQYFLEEKRNGYWRNTVETASIIATILPKALEQNSQFVQPCILQVNGDTNFVIKNFPFAAKLSNNIKQLTIQKTGGGFTYLSAYQKWFNTMPEAVSGKFNITTYFEKNGQQQQYITAGEKIKMVAKIEVVKDADYVMVEIPIPAGCIYASKTQDWGGTHKEFFKNKVVLFTELLKQGTHYFEIELEPRYTGKFVLNPAKAELMYFPVLFGRNGLKKIDIK